MDEKLIPKVNYDFEDTNPFQSLINEFLEEQKRHTEKVFKQKLKELSEIALKDKQAFLSDRLLEMSETDNVVEIENSFQLLKEHGFDIVADKDLIVKITHTKELYSS